MKEPPGYLSAVKNQFQNRSGRTRTKRLRMHSPTSPSLEAPPTQTTVRMPCVLGSFCHSPTSIMHGSHMPGCKQTPGPVSFTRTDADDIDLLRLTNINKTLLGDGFSIVPCGMCEQYVAARRRKSRLENEAPSTEKI
jgi:hypothetical protein